MAPLTVDILGLSGFNSNGADIGSGDFSSPFFILFVGCDLDDSNPGVFTSEASESLLGDFRSDGKSDSMTFDMAGLATDMAGVALAMAGLATGVEVVQTNGFIKPSSIVKRLLTGRTLLRHASSISGARIFIRATLLR